MQSVILFSDKRVSDWFLIGNLWPIMIISISYLLFVLKIGPEWMKNRQPYNLNQVMKLYNLFQVIGTSVLTYQVRLNYLKNFNFSNNHN